MKHALGGCHVDPLLSELQQLFSFGGVTGLGSINGLLGARLELGPDCSVPLIEPNVLAVALDLGFDIGHNERTS
jgi:hypothetical protein